LTPITRRYNEWWQGDVSAIFSEISHIQTELEQVQQILLKMLGRPSRWSGEVKLSDNPYIRGAKPFRCDILINTELAGQDERWRTLIHEMLHTFSAGYLALDYLSNPRLKPVGFDSHERLCL